MATYVVGDVQGCYSAVQRLLKACDFDAGVDRLWFCGDLINRGPQSLEVLRFVSRLGKQAQTVLGNHDFGLLVAASDPSLPMPCAYRQILEAPDGQALCTWLRHQPLLHYDAQSHSVLTHAGIWPLWSMPEARVFAKEVEDALRGPAAEDFLNALWGNHPHAWSPELEGWDRLRFIVNAFTRMRYCKADGSLVLDETDAAAYRWFETPERAQWSERILFGHWAALKGESPVHNIIALDTGYVWGGALTAYRLEDGKRFSVDYEDVA